MANIYARPAARKPPLDLRSARGALTFVLVMVLSLVSTRGQTSKGSMSPQPLAITFDDLPAHGPLPGSLSRLQVVQSILETLKQQQMPAVYGFINGVRTEEAPETLEVLRAWRAAGQPLANHTWSHPDFNETSAAQFIGNIEANQPLLRSLMSAPADDWHWLRYPYLNEGDTLEKHREVRAWLKVNHYQVAEVTMDFEDWAWNAPYARCTSKNDSVALQQLHDTYLSTADNFIVYYRAISKAVYGRDIPLILLLHVGAFDAHMLPELLTLYRSRRFAFVTLPQAAADPVYANDSDIAYTNGDTLTEQFAFKRGISRPAFPSKPMALLQTICR